MKKGFTLIELLAVIVILAIIAIIAVPIVINIINDAKKSSIERSAELYISGVELAIAKQNLQEKFNPESCKVQEDGNIICDEKEIIVEMNGEKPKEGTISLENSKVKSYNNLKFDNSYITMDENGKYTVSDKKSARIITFNYKGFDGVTKTYEAEEGMTWEEWINSEYKKTEFIRMETYIVVGSSTDVLREYTESENTKPTDIIKENGDYRAYDAYNNVFYGEECCFDAGTQVLMMNGTTKNIEDVKVGDMVMSYNETTHEFEPKKVLRTITKHHSDDLVYVNLSNGKRIGMRAYHPLLTTEGYKSLRPELAQTIMEAGKVGKLQIGDTLIGYNSNVKITSIEQRNPIDNYDTYNLEIEDNHNYIVNGIVAHNAQQCAPAEGEVVPQP